MSKQCTSNFSERLNKQVVLIVATVNLSFVLGGGGSAGGSDGGLGLGGRILINKNLFDMYYT